MHQSQQSQGYAARMRNSRYFKKTTNIGLQNREKVIEGFGDGSYYYV